MVFGLLSLVATVPLTASSVLTLQEQAEKNDSDGPSSEWKYEKCHIRCRATKRTPEDRKQMFQDSRVVICEGRLYVQLSTYQGPHLHPFSGYYLPFPHSNFDGIVSTISDNPPQLNWVYLDTNSDIFHFSHGLRVEAEERLPGPWGARVCSDGEKRYLFENWEGFLAVEDENKPGLWKLCFDKHDNGLEGKIRTGQRTVEVELIREEMQD
ncbi:uncharacterized protein SETTUDRAFT_108499 [Exserohilum turcica Et28A]|uniref:Uncharacterized protein n=1 Tax=Exserohilum turcicum (strain 28A) TaxID=671987 RepID=R0IT29_EXST2|nr:uncharacterized protein SETTUDRAFT_108499 [Exserohilum turcica Et28A]EOA87990.1 hypothetical protein SETTUDRAFT_108499 [Exserohilum turcica Et28A]